MRHNRVLDEQQANITSEENIEERFGSFYQSSHSAPASPSRQLEAMAETNDSIDDDSLFLPEDTASAFHSEQSVRQNANPSSDPILIDDDDDQTGDDNDNMLRSAPLHPSQSSRSMIRPSQRRVGSGGTSANVTKRALPDHISSALDASQKRPKSGFGQPKKFPGSATPRLSGASSTAAHYERLRREGNGVASHLSPFAGLQDLQQPSASEDEVLSSNKTIKALSTALQARVENYDALLRLSDQDQASNPEQHREAIEAGVTDEVLEQARPLLSMMKEGLIARDVENLLGKLEQWEETERLKQLMRKRVMSQHLKAAIEERMRRL